MNEQKPIATETSQEKSSAGHVRRRRRGGRLIHGRQNESRHHRRHDYPLHATAVTTAIEKPAAEMKAVEISPLPQSETPPPKPQRHRQGQSSQRPRRGRSRKPEVQHSTEHHSSTAGRQMIVNVAQGEECRIAILHQGKLEEIFFERQSSESHVGNIYKGVVTNVEPSIQAAFVDFGIGKNGFLHISDVQPQYFPGEHRGTETVGQKISRRDRPPIQNCLKRGDTVIAQVTKEGIGTKGPTLTTYLSIPGRYLVMMPGMSKLGVSRKIEDMSDRQELRDILKDMLLPPDMGFILRTAGLGQTRRELQRDLNYLDRLWKSVVLRIKQEKAPTCLYQESDLMIRTIRDVLGSDCQHILVDDEMTAKRANDFLAIAIPRSGHRVEIYKGPEPIFHKYKVEQEIERLHTKHVKLPSGGSLVIESTEALVAIDVNSGKFRNPDNAEATAYQINMEAAVEIARQLRLRDLGGLIICDFIDMAQEKHRRSVEKTLRDAMKEHKERVQILKMSRFGIIEITRQRQRPSIKRSLFQDCPHCKGSGTIKKPESMMLEIIRLIQLVTHREPVVEITVTVSADVGSFLLNRKRAELVRLEEELKRKIVVNLEVGWPMDQFVVEGVDQRGQAMKLFDSTQSSRTE